MNDSINHVISKNCILPDWANIRIPANRQSTSQLQRLETLYKLIPNGTSRVLDVGTRDCFVPELISHLVDYIVAVDIEFIDYELVSDNVIPVFSDATQLSFRNSSFDLVLCLEVLEHLPSYTMVMVAKELMRVTNKYLLVAVPFNQDLRVGKTTCLNCGTINPPWGHLNSFSTKTIRSIFKELKLNSVTYSGNCNNRTNSFSSYLMDLAGNPYGAYDQIEKCTYCGEKLVKPAHVSKYKILLAAIAGKITKAQRMLTSASPSIINMLFEK